MLAVTAAGGTVMPPALSMYNQPQAIGNALRDLLAAIMRQFGLNMPGAYEWQGM
jgi:3-polyprenyl-4-hydroxybenzoate decarboxylase